ncbi:unnamed protein product [Lymnaea stagnalis]|uniref:Uncharacterized protein n=1 Tax=Lymnaea stagnalis TaxID=6523 RepID=A0AAV2IP26_LYMST
MQMLPVLISSIAMIFFIEKSDTSIWPPISDRAFWDPIHYSLGGKSCNDGNRTGSLILSGFINVTGKTLPKIEAVFGIYTSNTRLFFFQIMSAFFNLWEENCTDTHQVPLDKCRCNYESATIVRVKCFLTAYIEHRNKLFPLNFITDKDSFSANSNMTMKYGNALCQMEASRPGAGYRTSSRCGNNGMPTGLIFLVTALVCAVALMIFCAR